MKAIKDQRHFNKKQKKSNGKNGEEDRNMRMNRTQMADLEIEELEKRISEETPPCEYYYLNTEEEEQIGNSYEGDAKWKEEKKHFKDLPLTKKTLRGLTESRFVKMTPIQKSSLPHSLSGRNILGASKTGSGKTLCFIIPVLELLYRSKWTSLDGLGALLILPTRELAIQVFEVFKMVGKYHDFSCGLVIGGNNLESEKERLYKMNILIGTPGRLLQHITETAYFNTDNLKLLVIDEVDRILDEGFEDTLNEIFSYLPTNRQTLLFSATLTRSLKRVAKVNLKSAEYININNTDVVIGEVENITEKSEISLLNKTANSNSAQDNSITPINLNQFYTLVEAHEKVDILYSFLNNHKNSKCLVFVNSCKQVRFFYEVFRRLKLGMTFLELHGKQKQTKRTTVFYSFLQKKNSVLFATDVASRGVDFPSVDWVIQLDCPEDMQTYIHRVGRTARYKSKGNSILFVNHKEENFVNLLKNKNIEIKKIKINQSKLINLQPILRSILSESPDMLHLAQKAISSYIKSIYMQNNKEIFDISAINIEQLALSYGLVNLPNMKIVKSSQNHLKNQKLTQTQTEDDNEEEREEAEQKEVKNDKNENETENQNAGNKKKSKLQKLREKIKQKKLEKTEINKNLPSTTKEEEDDFLQEKRGKEEDEVVLEEEMPIKKKQKVEKPVVSEIKEEEESNDYYEKIKKRLAKNEINDKAKEKLRVLEKHKHDRLKRKMHDYQKHGINLDEEEEEGVDFNREDNEADNLSLVEDEEEKPVIKTKGKKKVKINLKDSTLEEKEKAALELLNNTNNLFV